MQYKRRRLLQWYIRRKPSCRARPCRKPKTYSIPQKRFRRKNCTTCGSQQPRGTAYAANQGAAGRRGGRISGERRDGRGSPPASTETANRLLGQENCHCLHANHQGPQQNRKGIYGKHAGRVDCPLPWVRPLPTAGVEQPQFCGIPRGPDKANPIQMRTVRSAVRGIRVESARAAGAFPCGESHR